MSSRTPLHIWPAKPQQLESATLERSLSLLAAGGAAAAADTPAGDGSLLSPPIGSDGMPIKCWEIGPGTAVQDAVAHIVKLAAAPAAPPRPHSPGRLARGGGGKAGGGDGAASGSLSGAADDTQSEISHAEPEEVEMEPSGSGQAAAGQQPSAAQQPHDQQQQQQQALGSSASSPRSLLSARRPSLQRPGLDAASTAPRSPSQLIADSGSTLRSYALRCVHAHVSGGWLAGAAFGWTWTAPACLRQSLLTVRRGLPRLPCCHRCAG